MKTAKIFPNGRSQAVRLPKEYQFSEKEVYVKKFENMIILFSKKDPWISLLQSLEKFSDDFMSSRNQPGQQERDRIK